MPSGASSDGVSDERSPESPGRGAFRVGPVPSPAGVRGDLRVGSAWAGSIPAGGVSSAAASRAAHRVGSRANGPCVPSGGRSWGDLGPCDMISRPYGTLLVRTGRRVPSGSWNEPLTDHNPCDMI